MLHIEVVQVWGSVRSAGGGIWRLWRGVVQIEIVQMWGSVVSVGLLQIGVVVDRPPCIHGNCASVGGCEEDMEPT